MDEIVKKGEVINFNGLVFECVAEQIEIPQITTKSYLLFLCSLGKLKEIN